MMTTTHILVAAGATSRRRFNVWQNAAGFLGGLVPDLPMVAMVGVNLVMDGGRGNLWREPDGLYWNLPWQVWIDAGHSFVIWTLGFGLGYVLYRAAARLREWGKGVMMFCAGAWLHALCDFPVHTEDAHAQFWPLSDWRFHSPVSYYQRNHFGALVGNFEIVLGLAMAALLCWRFKSWWVRGLAVLLAVPYFLRFHYLFF